MPLSRVPTWSTPEDRSSGGWELKEVKQKPQSHNFYAVGIPHMFIWVGGSFQCPEKRKRQIAKGFGNRAPTSGSDPGRVPSHGDEPYKSAPSAETVSPCLSVALSMSLCLLVSLFVCLFVSLFLCLSLSLSLALSLCLPVSRSVALSPCLSLSPSLALSLCLPVSRSVALCLCLLVAVCSSLCV